MTVRVLLIGDVHLSDRPPSSCTDTYLSDLFEMFEFIVGLANDLEVDAVVQAGDMFHLKTPSRTSYATVFRAIEILKKCAPPFFIVPGNHDMLHDRLASVMETQPLGALFKADVAFMLNGWAYGPGDHLPIYGLPWLQEWTDNNVTKALWEYETAGAPGLVITHAPLFPPGQEPMYEFYDAYKFANAVGQGGVYYGHIHDPHGTYTVDNVVFCNNGAISRGSLTESNMKREVCVTMWDTSKEGAEQFTRIPIPHRPAEEIYRVAEVMGKRRQQAELDDFLNSVGTATLETTSAEQVLAHVKTLEGVDPKVIKVIESLLIEGCCG